MPTSLRVVRRCNALQKCVAPAVFFGGTPHRVLRAWRDGQFDVIYTPETLAELENKLHGKAIEFGADLADVHEWLAYIRTFAMFVPASGTVKGVSRDPKDDMFLDAAVSGEATHIVTGDKDLLTLSHFRSVTILSPRDFIELLEPQDK